MKRRHFLKGLGVTIALPTFESFGNTSNTVSASAKAKRFVCVHPTYGMNPKGFFPTATGANYELPRCLTPLQKMKKDVSVFTNLDHPEVGGGHGCSNTLLNGVELKDVKDNPSQMFSIDQYIAERICQQNRFRSLQLGSGGVSYSRAGVRLHSDASPERAFAKLFLQESSKVRSQKKQFLDEDKSILDVVMNDAKSLTRKLSKSDQDKLDEYLTSVREVEDRLQRRKDWMDIDKPKASDTVIKGTESRDVDLSYPYNTEVMYDIMLLALQTDSTKVISFGHPGGNRLFPFEGVKLGYHSLTHHGKRPDLLDQISIIEKYYVEQYARFLEKMSKTKDSEGKSMLDTTVVMFGSGMGNASSHSSRNLPIMVAGGGFKNGKHHKFDRKGRDGRPLCDLYVTMLQQLGIETDKFSTNKGNLNDILT